MFYYLCEYLYSQNLLLILTLQVLTKVYFFIKFTIVFKQMPPLQWSIFFPSFMQQELPKATETTETDLSNLKILTIVLPILK